MAGGGSGGGAGYLVVDAGRRAAVAGELGGGCIGIVSDQSLGRDRSGGVGAGESAIRVGGWGELVRVAGAGLGKGCRGGVSGHRVIVGPGVGEGGKPDVGVGVSVGAVGVELDGRCVEVTRCECVLVFGCDGGEASLWAGQGGRAWCCRVWASNSAVVDG